MSTIKAAVNRGVHLIGTPDTVTAGTAMAYLDRLTSFEQTGRLTRPSTRPIAALLRALGNPQHAYPVIHVTGTNGKGSTTAMIAGLLVGQGMSVGTYTSPHVSRVNERITFDGSPIEDEELSEAVGRVEWAAERTGVTPSWFEALTAAGLWFLATRHTEVAVIEVGMLGRWDATNVVDGTVAVITNIQLDHVNMAGPTRAAIAAEKAGIIKPGATLILGEPDPKLRPIFEAEDPGLIMSKGQEMIWRNRRAVPGGSIVDLVNPWGARTGIFVGMSGAFQCDNALMALTAAETFVGSAIPDAVVNAALAGTRLPGHFEIVHSDPTVVLDGAHNPAAAVALRQALVEAFAGATPTVLVCGALAGRDPVEFLDKLGAGAADLLIATEPPSPRALSAEALSEAGRTLGIPTKVVADPKRALDPAVSAAGTHGLVVATGSLYLISPLRAAAALAS